VHGANAFPIDARAAGAVAGLRMPGATMTMIITISTTRYRGASG
jgi:hypothetical protein